MNSNASARKAARRTRRDPLKGCRSVEDLNLMEAETESGELWKPFQLAANCLGIYTQQMCEERMRATQPGATTHLYEGLVLDMILAGNKYRKLAKQTRAAQALAKEWEEFWLHEKARFETMLSEKFGSAKEQWRAVQEERQEEIRSLQVKAKGEVERRSREIEKEVR